MLSREPELVVVQRAWWVTSLQVWKDPVVLLNACPLRRSLDDVEVVEVSVLLLEVGEENHSKKPCRPSPYQLLR